MLDNFALNRRHVLAMGTLAAATPLLMVPTHGQAKAPKLGAQHAKFWRANIGAFELTVIADSQQFIDGPYPIIGANASEAEVRQLMHENQVPETRYQPGFSPAIVNTGNEIVLFDTGNGANGFIPRPAAGWLAAGLAPAGFKPEDIDVVVLTHAHPDHVGGLIDNGAPLFPNARYVIGKSEYEFWSPEGKHSGDLEKFASVFRANTKPIADKISFVKSGDSVVPGVQAMEAYGHTPGHLMYLIESDGKRLLFWGDCAHHHVASLAKPDWHCVFDTDTETAAATRKRVFDMVVTDRLGVIGYHMPFPSVGYLERLPSSGYRWVPHSFQLYL